MPMLIRCRSEQGRISARHDTCTASLHGLIARLTCHSWASSSIVQLGNYHIHPFIISAILLPLIFSAVPRCLFFPRRLEILAIFASSSSWHPRRLFFNVVSGASQPDGIVLGCHLLRGCGRGARPWTRTRTRTKTTYGRQLGRGQGQGFRGQVSHNNQSNEGEDKTEIHNNQMKEGTRRQYTAIK